MIEPKLSGFLGKLNIMNKYYQNNKEKLLKYYKEYRQSEKGKEIRKKWYDNNKERRKEYKRQWYQNNKHKIDKEKQAKYNRQWRQKNRERANKRWREYKKNIYSKTPKFRITNAIRTRIKLIIKQRNCIKPSAHWEQLLGYTKQDLINHLEKQFDENMSWENYGSYWHIDHIKPVKLFNFNSCDDKEFKECWALSNLRPLERIENMRKGCKWAP